MHYLNPGLGILKHKHTWGLGGRHGCTPPFWNQSGKPPEQCSHVCTAWASTMCVKEKITVLGVKGYKQRIPLNEKPDSNEFRIRRSNNNLSLQKKRTGRRACPNPVAAHYQSPKGLRKPLTTYLDKAANPPRWRHNISEGLLLS